MNSIVDGSKVLSNLNIRAYYDLITNNPYETDLTHKETLDLLLKLEGKYRLRNFKMKYYPKVPLTQMLLKDKIISEKDIESNHEGSFELWKEDIDLSSNKDQKELYWDCLYYILYNILAELKRNHFRYDYLQLNEFLYSLHQKYILNFPEHSAKK